MKWLLGGLLVAAVGVLWLRNGEQAAPDVGEAAGQGEPEPTRRKRQRHVYDQQAELHVTPAYIPVVIEAEVAERRDPLDILLERFKKGQELSHIDPAKWKPSVGDPLPAQREQQRPWLTLNSLGEEAEEGNTGLLPGWGWLAESMQASLQAAEDQETANGETRVAPYGDEPPVQPGWETERVRFGIEPATDLFAGREVAETQDPYLLNPGAAPAAPGDSGSGVSDEGRVLMEASLVERRGAERRLSALEQGAPPEPSLAWPAPTGSATPRPAPGTLNPAMTRWGGGSDEYRSPAPATAATDWGSRSADLPTLSDGQAYRSVQDYIPGVRASESVSPRWSGGELGALPGGLSQPGGAFGAAMQAAPLPRATPRASSWETGRNPAFPSGIRTLQSPAQVGSEWRRRLDR
ncbi:MAG: hypothetical protein K9N49_04455 [Candidatus Marinimicrobia bacterium]|nr:hypothetical protein [Candidatus Neomarinimicrobiota bacterium]